MKTTNRDNIKTLIAKVIKPPILEYSDNIDILSDNVDTTIQYVKKRLGYLQELKGLLDLEKVLTHEEFE